MRYMASIYISDVMESVAATLEIQGWTEQFGPPDIVMQKTFVWPGVGETNERFWLQGALRRCIEDMSTTPAESGTGAAPMGGPYTISETGDRQI